MDPTVTVICSSASRSSWLVRVFSMWSRIVRASGLSGEGDHDGILEGGVFQRDFCQVAVRPVQDASEGRVEVSVEVFELATAEVVSESKGVVRLHGH